MSELTIQKKLIHKLESPLTAIEFLSKNLTNIPEEQKNLIILATKEIRAIAKELKSTITLTESKLNLGNHDK